METIVKMDPGEEEAYVRSKSYFNPAKEYAKKGMKEKAIDYYQRFIKLCPDTLAAYEAQAEIDKFRQGK
jgi:tetratricopeptide (TPR) repeat protein